MSDNEKLYDMALDAIKTLFNDRSVTAEECSCSMGALKEEIEILIDSLG